MCGLIYAADPSLWPELVSANLARAGGNKGAFTFTPVSLNGNGRTVASETVVHDASKGDLAKFEADTTGVTHLQAPTSPGSKPHPATILRYSPARQEASVRLWHNGIMQPSAVKILQEITGSTIDWDTELLAAVVDYGICSEEFSSLWSMEGSFACIAIYEDCLWAWRNPIAPLFTDGHSLSSVAVGEINRPLRAGVVYKLSPPAIPGQLPRWNVTELQFNCEYNPYGLV